jgi:hypothetical protein
LNISTNSVTNAEFLKHCLFQKGYFMNKKIVLLGFIACLTGCASLPTSESIKSMLKFEGPKVEPVGKNPLFINIVKDNAGVYRVDSVSNKIVNTNANLNKLEYNWSTDKIYCGTENNTSQGRRLNGGQYEHINCEEKKEFFYQSSRFINGSTETREISLVFDKRRFIKEVESALTLSGIDRVKTLNAYDGYVERHNNNVDFFSLPPDKFVELISK